MRRIKDRLVTTRDNPRTPRFDATSLRRDESGTMTYFGIAVTIGALVLVGFGAEMMRVEERRAHAQATLDRAILAAAKKDQKRDPKQVVLDYMAAGGYADAISASDVEYTNENGRRVAAHADFDLNPIFSVSSDSLGIQGRKGPYTIDVSGEAIDSVPNIEVSLVLDISGSMSSRVRGADGRSSTRIAELQRASRTFVDELLGSEDGTPGTPKMENRLSMSLVPYSEQVNIGPDMFNLLSDVEAKHQYSYCLDIPNEEFGQIARTPGKAYEQTQHFQWYDWGKTNVSNTVCPQQEYEQIVYWTQDADRLKTQIDSLKPRAQTSIDIGMKWGALLLDPSMQQYASRMPTASYADTGASHTYAKVDPSFTARPREYDQNYSRKVIVLMTDGANTESYRIADEYYSNAGWIKDWSEVNFGWWQKNIGGRSSYYLYANGAQRDTNLSKICDAAKAKGVFIFTIALDLNSGSHGSRQMASCSSGSTYHFEVTSADLENVFKMIAIEILRLRLVK